jgi:hypothetical protein
MAHGIRPKAGFGLDVAGITTIILSVALIVYVLLFLF